MEFVLLLAMIEAEGEAFMTALRRAATRASWSFSFSWASFVAAGAGVIMMLAEGLGWSCVLCFFWALEARHVVVLEVVLRGKEGYGRLCEGKGSTRYRDRDGGEIKRSRALVPPPRTRAVDSATIRVVAFAGTYIVLQKCRLLIETPCKHKYRVLNRSMADVLEVMGAWLALEGDDFDQVAGVVMMLIGGSRRRRRRRLRIAAAFAMCMWRRPPHTEYIR